MHDRKQKSVNLYFVLKRNYVFRALTCEGNYFKGENNINLTKDETYYAPYDEAV